MEDRRKSVFIISSIGLFLLGVFVYLLQDASSTFRLADRDFSVSTDREIVQIRMQQKGGSEKVMIEKDAQGRWRLNETMFANDLAVRDLIHTMSRLRVRQPVSIANREQVEALLLSKGVEVEVAVASHRIILGSVKLFPYRNTILSMIVGPDTPDGEATYMRKTNSQQAFKVQRTGIETSVSSVFTPGERVWRNPVVFDFKPHEIETIEVALPNTPQESFRLKPSGDDQFVIQPIAEDQEHAGAFFPDTARVLRFLGSFGDIYYESLLDEEGEALRKELMLDEPMMVVKVTPHDGQPVSIKAFERRPDIDDTAIITRAGKDPNRFYIQLDNGDFALAQFYVFNRILRPLSFFKNKSVEPS